jgi:uncharacterized spore protein YtfJ
MVMIMHKIKFPTIEIKILVGEEIKAGERTIFTVIKIVILKANDGRIIGSWITPLAMLIVEHGKQYAISIKGERMTIDAIMDLAPSLKNLVENICINRKIKIE